MQTSSLREFTIQLRLYCFPFKDMISLGSWVWSSCVEKKKTKCHTKIKVDQERKVVVSNLILRFENLRHPTINSLMVCIYVSHFVILKKLLKHSVLTWFRKQRHKKDFSPTLDDGSSLPLIAQAKAADLVLASVFRTPHIQNFRKSCWFHFQKIFLFLPTLLSLLPASIIVPTPPLQ